MSVRIFLGLTACVTGVIGITLLLLPGFIANLFLPLPGHGADIFIRFLGSSLIGYTYLNWYTTNLNHIAVMRPTLIGNLSTLIIASVVSIVDVLNHSLRLTGFMIIILHVSFATGFAWYLIHSRPGTE